VPALEKRLANVERWANAARKRSHNVSKLYTKRCRLTKERATALYRVLNDRQIELEQQGTESWLLRKTIVALANLVMWTRDHYFPKSFAHATWQWLAPFFHLSGLIGKGPTTVRVELRPFNDQQYNRDLVRLCEQVNTAAPQLPDGRRLLFQVRDMLCPVLGMQQSQVA